MTNLRPRLFSISVTAVAISTFLLLSVLSPFSFLLFFCMYISCYASCYVHNKVQNTVYFFETFSFYVLYVRTGITRFPYIWLWTNARVKLKELLRHRYFSYSPNYAHFCQYFYSWLWYIISLIKAFSSFSALCIFWFLTALYHTLPPSYHPSFHPTFLPSFLPSFYPLYFPSSLPFFFSSFLSSYLPSILSTFFLSFLTFPPIFFISFLLSLPLHDLIVYILIFDIYSYI